MATYALHFLTIVGRPGEEAAAGVEKLMESRLRLAKINAEGDFDDVNDPLIGASYRDEHTIGAFARGLLETVHRLPVIGYSHFVFNFAGPGRLIDTLGPHPHAYGSGPRTLHSYNHNLAVFSHGDARQTLGVIDEALARVRLDAEQAEPHARPESRMYLEHLRATHQIVPWVPSTLVVIEQCIDATREDFEIYAAAKLPLPVPVPIYYAVRPATPSDHEALVNVWLRSVSATHTFLSENDIAELLPLVRDVALKQLDLAVLTADDDPTPVGFRGMSGNKIEALFIDPAHHRRGGGRLLIRDVLFEHTNLLVDVNEQNPSAVAFYESMGFQRVGRSEVDDQGRPFPLIHLKL